MRAFWPDCCSLLAKRTGHLFSFHPETCFSVVILRSKATKNLKILRRVYPELAEGLRMT